MMRMRAIGVVALIVALGSCREGTGPLPFSGEYELTMVQGDSLPAVVYTDQFITRQITSSYLEIDESSHSFALISTFTISPVGDTTQSPPHTTGEQGTYNRVGDHLSFTFIGSFDPIPADIANGVITIHTATLGDWEYRR